jgi:hypothetical protein
MDKRFYDFSAVGEHFLAAGIILNKSIQIVTFRYISEKPSLVVHYKKHSMQWKKTK